MARRKRRNPKPLSNKAKIALALAVGIGLTFLARSAIAAISGVDLISKMSPKWRAKVTPSRQASLEVIQEVFADAGLNERVIAAAIANSWVESGWNPNAVGDDGHSIGLFQLNDWGAGSGLSVEFRKDPRNNAKTILEREVLAKRGLTLRTRAEEGAGVGELAAIFSRDIERPANVEGNMAIRKALAEDMFPSLA